MKSKKAIQSRTWRVGILLVFLAAIGLHLRQSLRSSQNQASATPIVPREGLAENDTGGKVPGNPDVAVSNFQHLYQFVQVYKGRHKEYPVNTGYLMRDIIFSPTSYNVSSFKDVEKYFFNPDDRFSDSQSARHMAGKSCPYGFINKRPDGTLVGSSKTQDKRDIIALCDTYVHTNVRLFPNGRTTVNPVGNYLVLWDDGQVEKIPYDHLLYVPSAQKTFSYAFPGQAGVPSNALTYDEYYKAMGWKGKAPRGSEGGKGQSYDGKTYR